MNHNAIEMKCIIGINEGYNHNNDAKDGIKLITELWNKYATLQENVYDMYISAVINKTKIIYKEEWGCPKGGEDTICISSVANPKYVTDLYEWKQICRNIITDIKKELKQSTVTITFTPTEVIYLE